MNGLNAYAAVAKRAENPRETEAVVLGRLSRRLQDAADAPAPERAAAVDENRRFWNALLSDLRQEDNQLPDALKAGLISLALWVRNHSSDVLAGRTTVEPLIEVNRLVARGLSDANKNQEQEIPHGTANHGTA